MKKAVMMIAVLGCVLFAGNAFAAYATAFSRAQATWVAQDGSGNTYTSTWTSATSQGCGTNCRRYKVWAILPINLDNGQPNYKMSRTYGRLWKNGTNGTTGYYYSDFDFRNTNASWGSEDYSNDYISGSGRRYYAYRYYTGTNLTSTWRDEIRFDYKYTQNYSWCHRRIDFAWGGLG